MKGLVSVNNAGRKESLAISENGRSKRPNLDAAKKKYEDALSRVNQDLTEFLDTYPMNVHVPVDERLDTKGASIKYVRPNFRFLTHLPHVALSTLTWASINPLRTYAHI